MPTSTFTVFLFSHFDASVEHVSKVETCQKSRTKVPYFDALEHSGTWSVLTRVCLKWTITLEQMYFQQGRLTFVKLYRSLESSTQDIRDGLICTVSRPHLLGRALIWPGYFGALFLGLFGLYSPSLSKSAGFVSLPGKASLVSVSDAILFLRS